MTTTDALETYLGRSPTPEELAIFQDQRTRIEFGVIYHPLLRDDDAATGLNERDPMAGGGRQ
ncbi:MULTISPECIES: hypothetical protein [Paracoccus]|uniref:hypothetical protein n=1 Tax=Paracoccus TaxID=265 RepID=UPI0003B70FE4|nr:MULTISPECIES: hypothetical protein [Paracoccus]